MCGICGILEFQQGQAVDRRSLTAMNDEIVHRGPDAGGFHISGNFGMAMRRLSIIDLAAGDQPMTNEDRTLWIVFNGEIYNYKELRSQLQGRHVLRTHSDTETVLHLYEEYGPDCVHHLRGMFAFAIFDERKRSLFIARDRVGIKPLYYYASNNEFLFASEIKALLKSNRIAAELNRAAIPEYLAFGFIAGESTMFTGVQKLQPGHWLQIDAAGKMQIRQYWDVPDKPAEPMSFEDATRRYRSLFEDAVRCHMVSDVPVGVFLSGGLDSSAVAAQMAKLRSDSIDTFSVGYDDKQYSELGYAGIAATHVGSTHHEVRVSKDQFFAALPLLTWHEDEPLVWTSSVPLYFVAKLARESVKVVLSGEGGDETMAGYLRYAWTRTNLSAHGVFRLVPAGMRRGLRNIISATALMPLALRRRLLHTCLGRDYDSQIDSYFDNFYTAFSSSAQRELLLDNEEGLEKLCYGGVMQFMRPERGDLINRLLYADIKTYLVELLMRQDNMSMAASVESRVPFLDHKLLEFALTIPGGLKIKGLSGKQVLKAAVAELLPREITHRRKTGFPTPLPRWLFSEMDTIEAMLLGPRSLDRGIFRESALRKLFDEHRARVIDHTDRIWRLLNLELWCRAVLEGDFEHGRTDRQWPWPVDHSVHAAL